MTRIEYGCPPEFLMYWTGKDPFTGKSCFVEKAIRGKERQKEIITGRLGDKAKRPRFIIKE